MWGLLAQSPDELRNTGDINYAMPLNFAGTPATITSRGSESTYTSGSAITLRVPTMPSHWAAKRSWMATG